MQATGPDLTVDRIAAAGRAVVIAPHPDDEVFAIGGLMTLLSWANLELEVVAVTDGEASHANSSRVTRAQLRDLRDRETQRAYHELGISPQRYRLGLPDSGVSDHLDALRQMLAIRLEGAAVAFAPIETDGHPDHDAVGRATREVAEALDVALWQYAVWARLNPERITQGEPGRIAIPSEVIARKRRAAAQYASQFIALGPDAEDGPVLPEGFLNHFLEPGELLWPAN